MTILKYADANATTRGVSELTPLPIRDQAGIPRSTETRVLTCNADADCITTETTAAVAELYQMTTLPSGCVGVQLKLEYDITNGVPYARGALVVAGAADAATAATRMSIADVGPSAITSGNDGLIFMGLNDELSISWAADAVDRVDVGFLLSSGTGAVVVRMFASFKY